MARPKKSPQGDQDGITEENAQGNETQGASPDQNLVENAEHQGEAGGDETAEENGGDNSPEASTDETKPKGEGENQTDSPNEEKEKTEPKSGAENGGDNSPALVSVVSESRKGQTIIAASGQPIALDNEGKAKVCEIDALYLKQIPGFQVG
ncbi:hypothetical protein AGMMS50268_17220 [Spirochaetia bacterium]|nr:hypothetical protein AGMMS50268_17220 [Spirochaetia bacterium]